jgi:hypothetical protein
LARGRCGELAMLQLSEGSTRSPMTWTPPGCVDPVEVDCTQMAGYRRT